MSEYQLRTLAYLACYVLGLIVGALLSENYYRAFVWTICSVILLAGLAVVIWLRNNFEIRRRGKE